MAAEDYIDCWDYSDGVLEDCPPEPNSYDACPKCGGSLVERHRKKDGGLFYGCINFPRCKFCCSASDSHAWQIANERRELNGRIKNEEAKIKSYQNEIEKLRRKMDTAESVIINLKIMLDKLPKEVNV